MPKSVAQRVAEYRARNRAKGLVSFQREVTRKEYKSLEKHLAELRKK